MRYRAMSVAAALVAALLTVPALAPASLPAPSATGTIGTDLDDIRSDAPPQGRAVERPDHDGPWGNAGFMYYRFKGSTKDYDIGVKIFYPASASGENTTPDGSGAPYCVLVMLPPMGGPEESYNHIAPRVVSWGYLCVVVGPNWTDFGNSGNDDDINEILDYVAASNATAGHKLEGMVDMNAVGIMGYSSGGGLAVLDAALVDRVKALAAFAPAIGDSTLDYLAQFFRKPFQFQAGEFDDYYNAHAIHGYNVFPPPKAYLHTKNGNHGGPFYWDCVISFFQRYLRGDLRYETFLYGDGAFDDMVGDKYFLNFRLENGTYFPAAISARSSTSSVDENGTVDFSATYEGYLPLGHAGCAFNWDFDGDGAADRSDPYDASATWRFTRTGLQKVNLWYGLGSYAVNGSGSLFVEVRNLPPVVTIEPDFWAAEDEPLRFSAQARDGSGLDEPMEIAWDFGDGTGEPFSGSVSATHAYARAGNYTLRVTARDPDGATATARANVSVSNLAPVVSATGGGTVMKDREAFFNGTMSDTPSDGPGLQCRWDFGDGLSTDWGTETDVSHVYTRSGNFTATFFVTDTDQALSTATLEVTVENEPPLAAITAPLPNGTYLKDREVLFSGYGLDTPTDNSSLQYRWDFGDGNLTEWAHSTAASHTYTTSGSFTVRLLARDGEGAFGASSITIAVRNTGPAVRLVAPAFSEAEEDEKIRFQAVGEDTESDEPLLNYTWVIDGATYFGDAVEVAFVTAGVKDYSITVRDADGAEAEAQGSLEVFNPAPRISAALSPLHLMENGTVDFSASADDTASDAGSLSFQWSFGDGNLSAEPSGSHRFARPGTYIVKVTVSDDEGATDEQSFTVTVQALPAPPAGDGTTSQEGAAPALLPLVAASVLVAVVAVAALLLMRRRE